MWSRGPPRALVSPTRTTVRAPSVCAPAPCVGAVPVNASPVRLRPLPTDLHPHSPHLRTAPWVCARAWIPSLARMRAEGFVL